MTWTLLCNRYYPEPTRLKPHSFIFINNTKEKSLRKLHEHFIQLIDPEFSFFVEIIKFSFLITEGPDPELLWHQSIGYESFNVKYSELINHSEALILADWIVTMPNGDTGMVCKGHCGLFFPVTMGNQVNGSFICRYCSLDYLK